MKPLKLTIKNIGAIADETITFDWPLMVFYGEPKAGKSTLLNCVRWVMGGSFPSDIIRHGAKEGSIELRFEGGSVSRSFYRNKAKEVVARAVEFIQNGVPVRKPSHEIERLLNPFLSDQDFFRKKNELERKLYLTELFKVDTTDLDKEAYDAGAEAQDLRATIKGYGEIDLTEVNPVDVAALKQQKAEIVAAHMTRVAGWKAELAKAQSDYEFEKGMIDDQNSNAQVQNNQRRITETLIKNENERIAQMEATLAAMRQQVSAREKWMEEHPLLVLKSYPKEPDVETLRYGITSIANTVEIDQKLSEAATVQVRVDQYQKNLARDKQRQADSERLAKLEARQKAIKAEKAARLKGVSETCGVPGLEFDEEGNFLYEGTQAGMLSTSQLMRLSSALSALYPEGFGIELLDRGESLGRAIFDYVKHAQASKTTVLATVVGQRPANVPEHVGVFVVKDGVVLDAPDDEPVRNETDNLGEPKLL